MRAVLPTYNRRNNSVPKMNPTHHTVVQHTPTPAHVVERLPHITDPPQRACNLCPVYGVLVLPNKEIITSANHENISVGQMVKFISILQLSLKDLDMPLPNGKWVFYLTTINMMEFDEVMDLWKYIHVSGTP